MKIIDKNKLFGKIIFSEKISDKQMRIIINKNFKKKSSDKKVLMMNSGCFFLDKVKQSQDKETNANYFPILNSILKQKIKKGIIEEISLDNENKKIKKYAIVSNLLTEIDSVDPRFIVLWHYNKEINIKLYLKKSCFFDGDYEKFKVEICPKINLGSRSFWFWFLFPFETKSNKAIVGFGPKTFIEYLKKYDEKCNLSEYWLKNKFDKNLFDERTQNLECIFKGVA